MWLKSAALNALPTRGKAGTGTPLIIALVAVPWPDLEISIKSNISEADKQHITIQNSIRAVSFSRVFKNVTIVILELCYTYAIVHFNFFDKLKM
jgi:hypothetical protein